MRVTMRQYMITSVLRLKVRITTMGSCKKVPASQWATSFSLISAIMLRPLKEVPSCGHCRRREEAYNARPDAEIMETDTD